MSRPNFSNASPNFFFFRSSSYFLPLLVSLCLFGTAHRCHLCHANWIDLVPWPFSVYVFHSALFSELGLINEVLRLQQAEEGQFHVKLCCFTWHGPVDCMHSPASWGRAERSFWHGPRDSTQDRRLVCMFTKWIPSGWPSYHWRNFHLLPIIVYLLALKSFTFLVTGLKCYWCDGSVIDYLPTGFLLLWVNPLLKLPQLPLRITAAVS